MSSRPSWPGTPRARRSARGYPDGLPGEDIPLGARVVAVCDAYDAMITDRPYRPSMIREAALEELARHAGEQFDPAMVGAFIRALAGVSGERSGAAA